MVVGTYGSLTRRQKAIRRQEKKGNCILSRYADDFILLCNGPKAEAERLKQELREYLWDELHLELSEEKTHITHATDGFDFLGFHIRREEPVDNKPWLRVTPTRKSEQRLRDTIRKMTSRATGWEPVPEKIRAINRVLRGWGNYYKQVSSSASREELDWWVSQRMLKWLCSRHKGLGKRVVLKKYLIRQGKRKNWGAGEGREKVYLFMLRDITHSEYHKKKLGNPYLLDGNELITQTSMDTPHLETWDGTTSRLKADWWETRANVLQRDGNRCVQCGSTEELEVHHLKPTGGNDLDNLLTLCQTCHANTPTYGVNRSLSHQG